MSWLRDWLVERERRRENETVAREWTRAVQWAVRRAWDDSENVEGATVDDHLMLLGKYVGHLSKGYRALSHDQAERIADEVLGEIEKATKA